MLINGSQFCFFLHNGGNWQRRLINQPLFGQSLKPGLYVWLLVLWLVMGFFFSKVLVKSYHISNNSCRLKSIFSLWIMFSILFFSWLWVGACQTRKQKSLIRRGPLIDHHSSIQELQRNQYAWSWRRGGKFWINMQISLGWPTLYGLTFQCYEPPNYEKVCSVLCSKTRCYFKLNK